MHPKFQVIFLEEAMEFLSDLDDKSREKVIYNIDKFRFINNPKLFKKLKDEIWEFRTRYKGNQYRLFAFLPFGIKEINKKHLWYRHMES